MKEERPKKKMSFLSLVAGLVLAASVVTAGWIMVNHLGLSDSLDFGAGAYYYADMPGFERWTDAEFYRSPVPMWALIVLFLLWGAAMMKLWLWLDRRSEDKKAPDGAETAAEAEAGRETDGHGI